MARPKKEKLEINRPQQGFNNALGALLGGVALPDLPSGPETPMEQQAPPPTKLGRVVLRRETAHRGGKEVIVIYDFAPQIRQDFIDDLARRLRKACGCGGTVHGREIEIQGNHAARLRELLQKEGFRVAGVS